MADAGMNFSNYSLFNTVTLTSYLIITEKARVTITERDRARAFKDEKREKTII